IIAGKSPVALGVEVAEFEDVELAVADLRQRPGDLAGDKLAAAKWRFVVEEDARGGVHPMGLAIIDRRPMGKQFGKAIGAARVERCRLILRKRLRLAEHL